MSYILRENSIGLRRITRDLNFVFILNNEELLETTRFRNILYVYPFAGELFIDRKTVNCLEESTSDFYVRLRVSNDSVYIFFLRCFFSSFHLLDSKIFYEFKLNFHLDSNISRNMS